jgi:MscS family membrane protein
MMPGNTGRWRIPFVVLALTLASPFAYAQRPGGTPAAAAQAPSAPPSPAAPAAPADSLGRDTPRGTVLGFMNAAREGRNEIAPLYLNTPLRGEEAVDLAHKLFVVLDSRLPARLTEMSDRPEGSLANPLQPNQDTVGVITTASGPLTINVERTRVTGAGTVWLFSRKTLDAIPDVYGEVHLVSIDRFLPTFTLARIAGIRLFEWLALAVLFPISYRLAGLIGVIVRPVVIVWRRRHQMNGELPPNYMHGSVRLLLLSLAIRWLLAIIDLPLRERMFWSVIATTMAIAAVAWALLMLNAGVERRLSRRFHAAGHGEIAAILRLTRRVADGVVLAAAVLVMLNYFGIDATAALAGLGIGGIAVALAAQKTLENVIGGLSLTFDKAVQVGDFLKLGDTVGMVDYIGLRSTRIRTLDRTVLSVPNGQLANANIETLSARDKFWFHHIVTLAYETTPSQMRTLLAGIRTYLGAHPLIDRSESVRVRFFRLAPFSLDVELFAYVRARDWEAFLEVQQELLLEVMDIIARAGATITLPSQTVRFVESSGALPAAFAAADVQPTPVASGLRGTS